MILKKLFIKISHFLWYYFIVFPKSWSLRFFGAKIGKKCKLLNSFSDYDRKYLDYLKIGNNVTIARRVMIFSHIGADEILLNFGINVEKVKNVIISDNVFIGAGSIILPGITIEKNSIIGAGSVVTKDVPKNSIYAGNPAKLIKVLK